MKKILFIIMAVIATIFTSQASDELTGRGLTLRNNIQNYLRSQGYSPEIDSDGDIKFKYEGKSYYVSIEKYGDEFYVETYGVMGIEDTNRHNVLEAANTAQKSLKFVRINVSTTTVSYGCVQAISSVAQYERLFEDFIYICKTARERLIENYED
ncbi:MAG: YbjN domain-containing protein [Clostridium sp.]|nr:YbjN domain-containing protein [Prevotella sp.]MCM1428484.1 YbjN domain-containing protein [Clostridium sp.]MCM1475886.1 YbjN domain-containing protein [Muribaculaceae bacterium]